MNGWRYERQTDRKKIEIQVLKTDTLMQRKANVNTKINGEPEEKKAI